MSDPNDGSPERPHTRAHERVPVDWRVSLKCPDWKFVVKVAAANVSRGGLFVLSPRPPPLGATVELVIELPDGERLTLLGTVRHVLSPSDAAAEGRGAGVGVRLHPTSAEQLIEAERSFNERHSAASVSASASSRGAEAEGEDAASSGRSAEASATSGLPVPDPPSFSAPFAQSSPIATGDAPRVSGEHDDGLSAPDLSAPASKTAEIEGARPWVRPKGEVAPIVGIDFGTSYSSVSVAIGDYVYIVPDEQSRHMHPSVVSYPKDGPPLMGWEARARIIKEPRRTVSSMKRLLGRSFKDQSAAAILHAAAWKAVSGPSDSILAQVGNEQIPIVQVCSSIIQHVKETAERQLDVPITKAVMSIPVTFSEAEKTALRRAAQLAGVEVMSFIEEPVASALAYGFGQSKNEILAVYDYGGGTFDFTVLDVSGDHFRVLASAGDSWLGGDDFDFTLASAVADAFWRATKIELRQRVVEWQRLLFACEKAKRALTVVEETYISVPKLIELPKRVDLHQKLTRPVFEKLCRELFERSLALCRTALDRAGLEPSDVTQVVISGGVSRIPFVQRGLAMLFERDITAVVNPDEAICLGAGIRAASMAEHECRGAYAHAPSHE